LPGDATNLGFNRPNAKIGGFSDSVGLNPNVSTKRAAWGDDVPTCAGSNVERLLFASRVVKLRQESGHQRFRVGHYASGIEHHRHSPEPGTIAERSHGLLTVRRSRSARTSGPIHSKTRPSLLSRRLPESAQCGGLKATERARLRLSRTVAAPD